eukprot:gene5467-9285_t
MNQIEYEAQSDDSFDGERATQLESSQMFQRMSQSDTYNSQQSIFCEFCQIPTKLKRNRNGESICLNCKNIVSALGTDYAEEAGNFTAQASRHLTTVKEVVETKKITKEDKVKLYFGNFQKIILKQLTVMIEDLKFSKNLINYFKDVWKSYIKEFFIMRKNSLRIRLFSPWHCLVFLYICCLLSREEVFLSDLKRLIEKEVIPYQTALNDFTNDDVINSAHPPTFHEFFSQTIPNCDVIWDEVLFIANSLKISFPVINCQPFLYKIYSEVLLFPKDGEYSVEKLVNYTCQLIHSFEQLEEKDSKFGFLSKKSGLEGKSSPPTTMLFMYVLFVLKILFGLCETECHVHPLIKDIIGKLQKKFSKKQEKESNPIPIQKNKKNGIDIESIFPLVSEEIKESILETKKIEKIEKKEIMFKKPNYEDYYVQYDRYAGILMESSVDHFHFQFAFFWKTLITQLDCDNIK